MILKYWHMYHFYEQIKHDHITAMGYLYLVIKTLLPWNSQIKCIRTCNPEHAATFLRLPYIHVNNILCGHFNDGVKVVVNLHVGHQLLTWTNFNPNMDK